MKIGVGGIIVSKSAECIHWGKRALQGLGALMPRRLRPTLLIILWLAPLAGYPAPNVITPDGATATSITISGNVTDIRTATIRNQNAFNSFKDFQLANGNVANLHLPTGTSNLINLVHDSRAVINGTLNSLMQGHIGGKVVFADPHGIVVGANGVMNVGSLMLTSPSQAFMNQLMAGGQINDAAVSQLLAGQAPLSDSGQVSVAGRINTLGELAVAGANVELSGQLLAGTDAARAALFAAAVNVGALTPATGMALEDGKIVVQAAKDVSVSGKLAVGASQATGKGGELVVRAGQDIALKDGAKLAAAGAQTGGDGGRIDLWADRDASVAKGVAFDASAGAIGDGGFIEVSAAHNVALDGLNADLGAGAGGKAGTFLIDPVNVTASSTAYYTNGGNVQIIASDSITLDENAVINTRHITGATGGDVHVGELGNPNDNPAGLPDPRVADLETTASVGDSGTVTLQAPKIKIGKNAKINTFATDGHTAGSITLESGDNFTCNICKEPSPGTYFENITEIGTPLTAASTDDVSITVEQGASLDARYVDRVGYTGAAGEAGDITLDAKASDMQVAGYSMAGAQVLVNGMLRGRNVNVSASADAGVNFGWLATVLSPQTPADNLLLLQQISGENVLNFHQNAIENMDDWTDITNVAGILGLPVTAGVVIADAKVEIGNNAVIEASQDVNISAASTRTLMGSPGGGLLAATAEKIGMSAIYGHLAGKTQALVSGNASISAGGDFNVTATSENEMEVSSQSMVSQPKTGHPTKGNQSMAFAGAVSYANVLTEAIVGESVQLHQAGAVTVNATNVDKYTTEASSTAQTATSGGQAKSQGGIAVAVSLWRSDTTAAFDAKLAAGDSIGSLDVVADNIAETHVTKSTVQTGNNLFDYLLGTKANRQAGLQSVVSGALGKAGGASAPKLASAASITVSNQTATARIGENARVKATGDVTVRARVIDQGIRNISDSRVNSTGPGQASTSGSVAFGFAQYGHDSQAIVGDGANIEAANIGVGAKTELPIDNDYEDIVADFDVTEWKGPEDFFGALNTIINAVLQPDVPAMESFGLADYLLTGYSNAYGDANEGDGTAVFGAANALIVNQNTRAWVGEGAKLTATGATGDWSSDAAINVEDADDLDISTATTWSWQKPVDVLAESLTETIGITGNLSLLTIISNRNAPPGKSVGGSFGWNQFHNTTIAGIGDGAVVNAAALRVNAHSTDHMIVIAPSAGQGKSMAGNGIFSYAQIDGKTHASIHSGARINAASIDVNAKESINLWAIGGAVAVSSETSVGAAIAANNISTDTRAYVGDNSDDRALEADEDTDGDGVDDDGQVADAAVADGSAAGLHTGKMNVEAVSEGTVGAIAVAAAASRSGGQASGSVGGSQQAAQNGKTSATQGKAGNNGVGGALSQAGSKLGGGGAAPGAQQSNLSVAGSGTLNFSRMSTVAEIRDADFIVNTGETSPDIKVQALTHVDQTSGSGSAAVSIGGGQGGRSTAIAGALAFNDVDGETRAGIYNTDGTGTDGRVGDVDVLAGSYGDILSLGLALAAASGQQTSGAAVSLSTGSIDADTTAEIENSHLIARQASNRVAVTGYDRSRVMVGGGAFYLGLGSRGTGGVGLAATYGNIDNDVSAYVRGSTLSGYDRLDVNALGAARIIAGAMGGAVNTGQAPSGAGSLYVMTLDSNLSAGITGSEELIDDDGDSNTPMVPKEKSYIDVANGVAVTARSSNGEAALDALISGGGASSDFDFDASALSEVDSNQAGFDPYDSNGIAGEVMVGLAGSLAISGGKSAAGFAVGFTDLRGGYTAEIRDSDVSTANGDVDVTALNGRKAIGVAAGAAVAGGAQSITLLGSAAITLSDTKVNAQILGDSNISADQVGVTAAADGVVYSLAGSLSATAGGAAIGAAATYNQLGGEVNATLGGKTITTDGVDPAGDASNVDVIATQDADIRTAAVAASISAGNSGVAVGGSATLNLLSGKTNAVLNADRIVADTVRVLVLNGQNGNPTGIDSLAGAITASSNAGFGAAFAINHLQREYNASVNGTEFVGTDSLVVHSTGKSAVRTLAVSGGASGKVAAGVSDTTSIGENHISARLTNVKLNNTSARVDVQASDASSIDSLAGAVQVGGNAAVGAAIAVNSLSTDIDAGITGGDMTVENLVVQGRSQTDIDTIAVGVAVSGNASVSGSVAVNHVDSKTLANINGGAKVTAEHNVGVLASSDDSVSLAAGAVGFSGAVLGGAGSVTVNILQGETEAAIRDAGTRVTAYGKDAGDTIAASGGELANAPSGNPFANLFDVGSGDRADPATTDYSAYVAPDLSAIPHAITGVVVDALALQQADSMVATAGISADVTSGVGVAAAVNTTVLGGSSRALVENATIGDASDHGAAGNLSVNAGHHAYGTNVMLGMAFGSVGAVGAADVDTFSGEATAAIRDSKVYSGGAVDVNAISNRDLLTVVAGVSLGTYAGVTGTGSVAVFGGNTSAEITGNSDVDVRSVDLHADSASEQDLVTLAGAGSIGVAVGGAVNVAVNQSNTTARIGDDSGNRVQLKTQDKVAVKAENRTRLNTVVAAAAVGTVGVAGAIGVQYVGNKTRAGIKNADLNVGSTLDVTAKDSIDQNDVTGGLAAGSVAAAVGVNIGIIKNLTSATIKDSNIVTGGDVNVTADRDLDVRSDAVVGSISNSPTGVAISGGVNVLLLGGSLDNEVSDDADGDLSDELGSGGGDWIGKADSQVGGDQINVTDKDGNHLDRSEGGMSRINATPTSGNAQFSSVNNAVYGVGDDGVEASVTGGSLKAGDYQRTLDPGGPNEQTLVAGDRNVNVAATDRLRTHNQVVAVALGGAVSLGAGVGVTQVNSDVAAEVDTNLQAASVAVTAQSLNGAAGEAAYVAGYSGGAGLVGIGAAIGVAKFNGSVQAGLGGSVLLRDKASVNATDETTAEAKALGAAAGGGAVGVAIAVASRTTDVAANVEDNTELKVIGATPTTDSGLKVTTKTLGETKAWTEAAAGGVAFAVNASVAVAKDQRQAQAGIGQSASIWANGNIDLLALALPRVSAESGGDAIAGGASVGGAVAYASSDITLNAKVGNNTLLVLGSDNLSGALNISAEQQAPNTHGDRAAGYDAAGIRAKARAINGSIYLSANAAVSTAEDKGSVSAQVGDGVLIGQMGGSAANGSVAINASREAALQSETTGVVIGGLAVGASIANANSDGATNAYFGGELLSWMQDFQLAADSVTDTVADATSGSGGLVAGAAASAHASDDGDATATLGDNSKVAADTVAVTAHHNSRFQTAANSVQASVVGFSGSFTDTDIDNQANVRVGKKAEVAGYQLAMTSDSDVNSGTDISSAPGREYSVKAGAGGVVNGSAGESDITINKGSHVVVDDEARLQAYNRPNATAHSGLATLALLANGSVNVDEKAYLEVGGAIQAPFTDIDVELDGSNRVDVGDRVILQSEDLLGISAYETQVNVDAHAVTKTWGAVGVAGSKSVVDVDYDQQANVGQDSHLEGLGYVFLTAGRRADTTSTVAESLFDINAISDTYNWSAIPIDTTLRGTANVHTDASAALGAGSELIAGWDATLGGTKGTVIANGVATGHNPYLELLSTETTDHDENVSGVASLKVNGNVIAGYFNQWDFNVAENGQSVDVLLNGQALDPSRMAQDKDAYINLLSFDPQSYVEDLNDYVASLGSSYRSFADQINSAGLPTDARVVRIHDVTATQGNVFALGDVMQGNGSLEARGGASITVTNPSRAWLDVGNLTAIDHVGGRVLFTGAIPTTGMSGVTVNEVNADQNPAIAIVASGSTNSSSADDQPGLMVSGPLYNQLGLVSLYNRQGNIYQGAVIEANQVRVVAPNGAYVLIAPDDTIHVGGTPWSAWAGPEWDIGASDVIAYALQEYTGYANSSLDFMSTLAFNAKLYDDWGYGTARHDTDDGTHYDRYGISLVPYNTSSVTGASGDRGYTIFDKEYRQAKFDWVSLKPFTQDQAYAAGDHAAAAGGGVKATKVLILADVLNINAPIVAGQTNDVDIKLDSSMQGDIADWVQNGSGSQYDLTWYHEGGYFAALPDSVRQQLGLPPKDQASQAGWYALAPGASVPFTADSTVSGHYDRATGKIVINGVEGATTGYIAVDAKIVSTNQAGRLEVLNGYSNISIDNQTGYGLVLNDISTGTASTGVIEVTDRLKNQRVWYVNQAGGATHKYVSSDLNTASWRDNGVNEVYSDLGVYRPQEGTRFWWDRKYQAKRSINSTDYFNGTATPWEFVDADWNTGTTGALDGDITASGICNVNSDCGYKGDAAFHQEVTNTEWHDWWDWTQSTRYGFSYEQSVDGWAAADQSSGHKHQFRWPLRARMTTQSSVKADYDIGIVFSGSSTGSINVTSNAGVTIDGRLSSLRGDVTMNINGAAGNNDLLGLSDALVEAVNANLNVGGRIGAASGGALNVNLSGVLNASATGSINLASAANSLTVGQVASSNGKVSLLAGQSLLGQGSGVNVKGLGVELSALGGHIGHTGSGALVLDSQGGRIDAAALDDIALAQNNGDMALGSVVSLDGDVAIRATNGNIVNANDASLSDLESLQDLRARWAALGITAGAEADGDAADAIAAYKAMVEREYRRYWQFDQVVDKSGATPQVTAAGQRLYSGLASANGKSVNDYVLGEQQRLETFFEELYATTDLAGQAGFDSYDGSWQYTLPQAMVDSFNNGAVWSEKRLENAVNAAAVGSAAGTGWLDDSLNVSGKNITLIAGQNVGGYGDHNFSLDSSTTITDQQRAWLLTAAPGGLDVASANDGTDKVNITVRTLSRLRLNASGVLKVEAGTPGTPGNIFVGADNSVQVDSLKADGQIYLAAADDITYAALGNTISGAAGGLTLNAVRGGIFGNNGGSFDIGIDGDLIAAIAGTSVNINDVGGAAGLTVGLLDAQDKMKLTTSGDLLQLQGRSYTVAASSLELQVGGNVGAVGDGSSGTAGSLSLNLRADADGNDDELDGTLFGEVGGDAHLSSAGDIKLAGDSIGSGSSQQSRDLNVAGKLTLTGDTNVQVAGQLNTGAGASLQASNALNFVAAAGLDATTGDVALIASQLDMADGSSVTAHAGTIDVGVTGDARLALLDSGANDAATTTAIVVTAGGNILSNRAAGQRNLVTVGSKGVELQAGADIGNATVPLVLDVGALTVDAHGNVELLALRDLAGDINAQTGYINLVAKGAAALDQVHAGTSMHLYSRGDLGVQQGVAGTDMRLDSDDALTFGSLVAGATLTTESVNDTSGGSIQANGDLHMMTGYDQGQAVATSSLMLQQANAANIDLNTTRDLLVMGSTSLTATQGQVQAVAGGNIGVAGDVSAQDKVVFNAQRVLQLEDVTSGGTQQLLAADNLGFSRLTAGDDITAQAGADMQGGDITTDGKLQLDADDDMTLGQAQADGTMTLGTGGNMTFALLDAGDQITAIAGREMQGGDVTTDADLRLDADDDMTLNNVHAGGQMQLGTGDNLQFALLDGDGKISAQADDDILGGDIRGGSDLMLNAGGNMLLDEARVAGAMELKVRNDFTFTLLDAQGRIDADVGGYLMGGDVISADSLQLLSGNDMTLDDAEAGQQIGLVSGGNLTFDSLVAPGRIETASHGDTTGRFVHTDTALAMTTGLQPDGSVANASLHLVQVEAPEVLLRTADVLEVQDLFTDKRVDLQGGDISARIHDAQDGLLLSWQGGNADLADQVDLTLDGSDWLYIEKAHAADASLHTSSNQLSIRDAWVTRTLSLVTPRTYLYMNNVDATTQRNNVQLFEQDKRFQMDVQDQAVATDAYVTHYQSGWTVTLPNYSKDHAPARTLVQGPSAALDGVRAMQNAMDSLLLNILPLPQERHEDDKDSVLDAPLAAPAVNLGQGGVAANDSNHSKHDQV